MPLHIGTVVLDVADMDRAAAFWSAALRYETAHVSDDWTTLKDAAGRGVPVGLQPNADAKRDVNRVHLDLHTPRLEDEVARLEALGAKRVPWEYAPDANYVVLVDTEGNEFCIVRSRED